MFGAVTFRHWHIAIAIANFEKKKRELEGKKKCGYLDESAYRKDRKVIEAKIAELYSEYEDSVN